MATMHRKNTRREGIFVGWNNNYLNFVTLCCSHDLAVRQNIQKFISRGDASHYDQKASVRRYICLHSDCEARCTYLAAICNLTANSHHTLVSEQCNSMESSSLGSKTYVICTDLSQRSRMYWDLHPCLPTQCKHIGRARKLGTLWNHQQCPHRSIGRKLASK